MSLALATSLIAMVLVGLKWWDDRRLSRAQTEKVELEAQAIRQQLEERANAVEQKLADRAEEVDSTLEVIRADVNSNLTKALAKIEELERRLDALGEGDAAIPD